MVSRFLAFFEDIGHAVGVAYFDEPITQRCRDAIVEAVEAASFPWGDELLMFPFAFHLLYFIAPDAKADLWSDTQSRYSGFVMLVFSPLAEIDVEQ